MEPKKAMVVTNDPVSQDSLNISMSLIPVIGEVRFSSNWEDCKDCLLQYSPDVFVIDTGLGRGNVLRILDEAQSEERPIQFILLADAQNWREWRYASGRFSVLLKGFSILHLAMMIQTCPRHE